MGLYAAIDAGKIVGRRDIPDWDTYPKRKKDARDEKGDGNPTLRPIVFEGDGSIETEIIEPDKVRVVRSLKPVSQSDVEIERRRRLALGFDYDFGDRRGTHHIATTPGDMEYLRDIIDYANALIDSGDTATVIPILTDTGPAKVTAPEWQAVMLQASAVRLALWDKSFALQSMNPIPMDYADDSYWT